MSRRVSLTVAIILGVVIGCGGSKQPPPPPPPAVTVVHPIEREVIEWDEYSGRLEAVEFVEVRARVSGFVQSAPFEEGAIIEKGTLLFVIDDAPFKAALDQAKAQLQSAQAKEALAATEFQRVQSLRTSNSATEIEFEQAKATLAASRADVAAAQALIEARQLDVEWCRVTAPISGRVSRKGVTAGNLINGGAGQATLLTTITSLDPIYCYMDVDERSVLKYQQLSREKKRVSARDSHIPVFMGLSDEPGFPHDGVIDFVDNRIDPQTGTIRGRGVFPNPNGWMTPGLFARVRIPGSGRYRALLIPEVAIGSDQNQKYVLVVGADNKVDYRVVEVGARFDGGLRAIEKGISANDRVIVNGQQRARPGAVVAPEEKPLTAVVNVTAPGSPTTQALPATRNFLDPTTPATHPTTATAPTTGAGR